jgi:hypothetical protein
MSIKRCPWCGTENPSIYEHCIKCGGPLPLKTPLHKVKKYLIPAIVLVLLILVGIYLVIPVLHLSVATGMNMSAAISSGAASLTPVPCYDINEPVRDGDLQVMITQARAGQNTFNAGRFYTVTASIQNFNQDTTISIPSGDFVLADSRGNYYYSTGIGSKVSYDALPGTTGLADLVYIVPQDAQGLRVLYTFPVSLVPGAGRHEVAFVL